MSDLPSGWTRARLGDLCEPSQYGWTTSATTERTDGLRILRTTDITKGPVNWETVPFCVDEPPDPNRYRLAPGDILISRAGSVGFSTYLEQVEPSIFASYLIRFRPLESMNGRYLAWFLKSPGYWARIEKASSGITLANVNAKKLSAIDVPVAAVAEQERIVAAIEEQFSRLDAGVVALERARRNLKRMRAAVLQGAVRGALRCTDQRMTPLADLISVPLANGKSVPDGPDNGFLVLRLTAVRDGWIDVTYSKKGAWTAAEAKPYVIKKDDYLVIRGNGSKHLVGRGAMVSADSEVAYPDTLIRLRFDETAIVPKYAALMWESGLVRNQIEGAARTTAGIYKINQKDLGRVTFPVPSIEDQLRIYASAENILHGVGALESELNSQLQRSMALRSSILAVAFSGKLVPQDVSDVAASVLLERIAAERASSNGQKSTRTRKPRTPRKKAVA